MGRARALIIACAVLCAPAAAHADDDYFVKEGFRRDGLMFGFAFGGGGFLSTSCCDIGGRRGAATGSVRIGTVMAPNRLLVLQADAGNVFVKQGETTEFNRHSALTLGVQQYLFETFWLKFGAGFATYTISADDDATAEVYRERNGYSVAGSIGYDFLRKPDFFIRWRQDFALSVEFGMVAAVYPGGAEIPNAMGRKEDTGLIIQLHTMLGFVWY